MASDFPFTACVTIDVVPPEGGEPVSVSGVPVRLVRDNQPPDTVEVQVTLPLAYNARQLTSS